MKTCSVEGCEGRGLAREFCQKHYYRFMKYKNPLGGRKLSNNKGEGWIDSKGYKRIGKNYKNYLVHRLIIEKVVNRPLKNTEVIHHVDGNPLNNLNSNLVLCESKKYHELLHQRKRAFDFCNHASWRRCIYCKQFDDPKKMYVYQKDSYVCFHRECRNIKNHQKKRR